MMMDRKDSHLGLALEREVEFPQGDATGFGALRLEHDALVSIANSFAPYSTVP